MPFLIAENFLEKPTAFGVPLGALLLFFWLMRAINESRNSGQSASQNRSVPLASTRTAGFAPSTEAIPLFGEVDDSVVTFLSSGFKQENGRVLLQFRVRLHEGGTYLVAGGQHQSGRLSESSHGYTMVSGRAGETISGTVSCPWFSSGKWAIGAFRTAEEIPLA